MELLIGSLIGVLAGGAVAFVIQNVILKNKKQQILKEAELEG